MVQSTGISFSFIFFCQFSFFFSSFFNFFPSYICEVGRRFNLYFLLPLCRHHLEIICCDISIFFKCVVSSHSQQVHLTALPNVEESDHSVLDLYLSLSSYILSYNGLLASIRILLCLYQYPFS